MNPSQRVGGRTVERVQNYTPQQMKLHQQQFGMLGPDSYLYQLAQGDPQLMEQMERGALRDFSGQMGNLSSRFSGQGTGGRHSSGFKNASGMESRQLQENLQAQRHNMRRQAITDLMGLSNQILGQDPYDYYLTQPKKSLWQQAIGGMAPLAGAAVGAFSGGPQGAQMGYNIGNQFGSGFSGGN
jgi:hypothetical protein